MIYLDNAATTRVDPAVVEAMREYHLAAWGNPSSMHRAGVEAAAALRNARETLADLLDVEPREIVFTSGGTESNSLAIRGAALLGRRPPLANAVCSAVEHAAVLDCVRSLADDEIEPRLAPVDATGRVLLPELKELVDRGTRVVSVMHANNEVGTIQPIARIGRWLKQAHPRLRFHVDAVQSFLTVPLSPRDAGVDLLTASSHKIHGPKGVGLLWIRKGVRLKPLFFGGGQQAGVRPGTENVPGIVGFAEAARLASRRGRAARERVAALRDRLVTRALAEIPGTALNGPDPTTAAALRLPGNANLDFEGCAAEMLLHHLEAEGVAASSGSACHSSAKEPSHVLVAMGARAGRGAIRFSLSHETTEDEIDRTLDALHRVVAEVRSLSRQT